MVELSNSTGWDFESTIKFNASTGEEYCEWFVCGVCGTEVAFNVKQAKAGWLQSFLSFLPETSKLQSAVYSVRMEVILPNTSLLLNTPRQKKISWSRTDIIDILAPTFANRRNCSHNRTAKRVKIYCLPEYFHKQLETFIYRVRPWFLAELDYWSKSINIFTCIYKHPRMPGYKKKTQSTSHVFNPTSDRFCLLLAIKKNRMLPRWGSPAIRPVASSQLPMLELAIDPWPLGAKSIIVLYFR